MKTMTMKLQAAMLACAAMVAVGAAQGQVKDGTIHGHVNNPIGQPVKGATVQFTKQLTGDLKDRKFDYKFPVDESGDYKGTLPAGEYFGEVTADGRNLDFADNVKLAAGEDKTLTFDMSRKEYVDKMTPEEKTALEEYKKKAGAAMEANKVISNLNATLKSVREDLHNAAPTSADVTKDVTDMKNATTAKPDESVLWITYGDTLQAQGDHLAKADKDAHKPVTSDADAMKLYSDAADAFKKGADLNAASKKPAPADQAIAYNQMGNALAKAGKTQDATAAFEKAATLDPTKAGMYYGNEAAILFNNNATAEAAAAADKAIAADPNKPDPYFVKGQALIGKATVDKSGKIVAPPECIAAYQKYLELAPEGKFAPQVKDILTGMGQTVNTKYKASGKK